ncbi:DNA-binding protein [Virgibacillus indicus]|uniref:DNA-binding protein n=1 Tax=Virgibacillus indicus TaxID=2024554 RepID=A0A265NBC9_9BACI|nr:small multi-drug export protein [Virgibacillus indicus]OZU89303.1 DNA-binding protein [Virgibacillus indicus]
MLLEYALVFIGAAIPWLEIALVIPVAILGGLSPLWVILLAFIGNVITVLPVIIGFEKVKTWYQNRKYKKGKTHSNRTKRGKRIWNKYGLPGLAFLGPILTGTHVAAFIGMTLGGKKQWVMLWMTVSIGLWSIIFGMGTAMGLDIFI